VEGTVRAGRHANILKNGRRIMEVKKTLTLSKKSEVKYYLQERENSITLMAEDSRGNHWYILTIKNGSPIILYGNLPDDLGFTTEDRYPEVVEEV
jgi:hypothetical protein